MSQFGQYRLLRRLAVGGMGEIYLAKLKRGEGFEKIMVIKRILPSLSDDQAFVSMFNREACIAAQFIHQNVVQIFDYGQHSGAYFIAMEYVHGRDLRALVEAASAQGQVLPVSVSVAILTASCNALDYAHRHKSLDGRPLNVVHRDVSPQNILISYEGAVKLTDFGLAQRLDIDSIRDGQIQGKFAYMSPEQTFGDKLDRRSDIFSLGIVAYEMFCGQRPFQSKDLTRLMLAIREGDYTPPSELRPELPKALDGVLARALAVEPYDRYDDAREFCVALESLAREHGWLASSVEIGDAISRLCPDKGVRDMLQNPDPTQAAGKPVSVPNTTQAAGTPIAVPDTTQAAGTPIPSGTQAAATPIPSGTQASAQPISSARSNPNTAIDAIGSADTDPLASIQSPVASEPSMPSAVIAPPPSPDAVAALDSSQSLAPVKRAEPQQTSWLRLGGLAALLLLAGVVGGVAFNNNTNPTAGAQQEQWMLDISAEPVGAEIYIDGERKGTSPMVLRVGGDREVKVEFRERGYHNFVKTVALGPGGGRLPITGQMEPEPLSGHVILTVQPPEAFVKLDGKLLTPDKGAPGQFSITRPPGMVALQVFTDGYETDEKRIQVPTDSTLRADIALRPLPVGIQVRPTRKVSGKVTIEGPGFQTNCNLPCRQQMPTPGRVQVKVDFDGMPTSKSWISTQIAKPGQNLIFLAPVPKVRTPTPSDNTANAEPRLSAIVLHEGRQLGLIGANLAKKTKGSNRVQLSDSSFVTLRYSYIPATGQLNFTIGAAPYSAVSLNGVSLGNSPVSHALKPGSHTLRLGALNATVKLTYK